MNESELKERTKNLGLRCLRVVDALPETVKGQIIARQLGRCGTAVGANYRAACRGRSQAEFIAKLGTVVEEADETAYWLELIMDDGILPRDTLAPLWKEADEIVAIMISSRKTAEKNKFGGKAAHE